MPSLFTFVFALACARAATAQLLLRACDVSAVSSQMWVATAAGELSLASHPACVSASSGCCSGEGVRGGDALSVGACAGASLSRALQAQDPQLALAACSVARAHMQTWAYDATNSSLVLVSTRQCIDILAYGTTAGSEAYTAACHHEDKAPTHQNQEWSPPATTSPGSPLIQPMSGLPLGACSGPVAPGALLTLCAASDEDASRFILNAGGSLIHANSGLCVDAGVHHADPRALFAWPVDGGGPIVSTAPPGDGVSPSMNGAPLVIASKGRGYDSVPVQLLADRGAADSTFVADGPSTGSGAHLVHAASGLCLTAGGTTAWEGPAISLAPCDAARQTPGDFFGSQLFKIPPLGGAPGNVVTSRAGQCVTAEHVWGAHNSIAGEVRLIGASCSATPTAAQTFSYLANGTFVASSLGGLGGAPANLVIDAGVGAWRGAPVSLQPTGGAATSVFSFKATGADPTLGVLLHERTGLCLDAGAVPYGVGCLHPSARVLPFCDAALSLEARVTDLVSRLTLAEASSFTGSGEFTEPCVTNQDAIKRLDVPAVRQLVEVTSMASSSCDNPYEGGCATSFASGLLLGGSFNRSSWVEHGVVVGREIRALSNIASSDATDPNGNFITLSGHGPDVNAPRDPRNGRIGELISEDPFLTGAVAEKRVRGMQFGGDIDPATYAASGAPHVMLASLKHYNAYSRETQRMTSVGNVSVYDLWDTYLPQFERPMVKAAAAGTMCSYFSMRLENATGEISYIPSCADSYLLTDIVRTYWNRSDATHLTDCGAIYNMAHGLGFTHNNTMSAAVSINAGCDMNSNTITPTQMHAAVELGFVKADTVLATAARVLAQRFRTGQFDPLETAHAQALLALGAADVGTAASRAIAAEGVAQGLVLVKNERSTLPLSAGLRIAVLGPQGSSFTALTGDCYCGGYCATGSACFPSLATAITNANAGGETVVIEGVQVKANDSSWGAAIAAVATSDVVILALGTDRSVAAEGSDRSDGIGLPGVQGQFGSAVLAAAAQSKARVVLLLLHNLPVSFDELADGVDAIVDAWAPLAYSDTIAAALFGGINRWGKATMSILPKAYANAVSLFDYSMTKPPGRTYRYYDGSVGAPLIAFGEGKSYSTFAVTCDGGGAVAPGALSVHIECSVANTGGPDGDECLLIYHRPSAAIIAHVAGAHPLPLRALVGFDRVSIPAGGVSSLAFDLPLSEALGFVDATGATVLYPGEHFLDVSNGNGANITLVVTLDAPRAVRVRVPPPRVQ